MSVSRRSARACPPESVVMLYRALLLLVVALVTTSQAQEDLCVGHEYAETHCARPPAYNSVSILSDCVLRCTADGECCSQGNYKMEGHACAAAPPTLTFTHPAWRAARIRHSGSGSGSSSRHPLGTPPNPVQGAAGEVAGELDGQHHARLFALLAGMSARRSARRSRHAKSCERLGVACLADAPPFAPGAVAACRAGNDSHRPAVDRIARAVCTSACLGR